MDERELVAELHDVLIKRLRFDPARLTDVTPDTPLPKGVEGGLGLDSLDFIELAIAIEERFAVVVGEDEDVRAHFATLGTLARFVKSASPGSERS
jgi:acyl carrier protein